LDVWRRSYAAQDGWLVQIGGRRSQGVHLNEHVPGQTDEPRTEQERGRRIRTDATSGSEARRARGIVGLIVDNPGSAIYGTIAVGALLAAESVRRETYARNVVAVVITLLLYWLAHSYADLAAERLRSGAPLTVGRLVRTMLEELPLLAGATIPLATLLICWAAGTRLSVAVIAALWTSAAIVVMIELSAGVRGHLAAKQFIAQVLVGALLGSLVIFLKVVLH
jgi:hypothetical protein